MSEQNKPIAVELPARNYRNQYNTATRIAAFLNGRLWAHLPENDHTIVNPDGRIGHLFGDREPDQKFTPAYVGSALYGNGLKFNNVKTIGTYDDDDHGRQLNGLVFLQPYRWSTLLKYNQSPLLSEKLAARFDLPLIERSKGQLYPRRSLIIGAFVLPHTESMHEYMIAACDEILRRYGDRVIRSVVPSEFNQHRDINEFVISRSWNKALKKALFNVDPKSPNTNRHFSEDAVDLSTALKAHYPDISCASSASEATLTTDPAVSAATREIIEIVAPNL